MEKLSNGQSAFAQGADRLGDVARTVKNQQVSDVQGVAIQSPRMSVIAPDEVWAKKFINQGIGSAPDMIGVSGMTPMPHTTFVMAEVAPPRISVGDAVKRTASNRARADELARGREAGTAEALVAGALAARGLTPTCSPFQGEEKMVLYIPPPARGRSIPRTPDLFRGKPDRVGVTLQISIPHTCFALARMMRRVSSQFTMCRASSAVTHLQSRTSDAGTASPLCQWALKSTST